jgi:hypothetical protein
MSGEGNSMSQVTISLSSVLGMTRVITSGRMQNSDAGGGV